jgi:hypothetical protein
MRYAMRASSFMARFRSLGFMAFAIYVHCLWWPSTATREHRPTASNGMRGDRGMLNLSLRSFMCPGSRVEQVDRNRQGTLDCRVSSEVTALHRAPCDSDCRAT